MKNFKQTKIILIYLFIIFYPITSIISLEFGSFEYIDLFKKKEQERNKQYEEQKKQQELNERLEQDYLNNKNKSNEPELNKKNAPIKKIKKRIKKKAETNTENKDEVIEESTPGCFNITEINLINIKNIDKNLIISKYRQQIILQKYLNACLSLDNLDDIIADLTNWYIGEGYTTTRVYLKPQNIASGIVNFYVMEGEVEKIITNENKWYDKISTFMAFPYMKNKVFTLRDIEQGIDQFNSLQSNNATSQIAPSEIEGKSIIIVNNKPENSVRLFVGVRDAFNKNKATQSDYYKTNEFSKAVMNTRLETDNLFLLNESLVFSYNYEPRKYSQHRNEGFTINSSIPFGYTTFSGSYGKRKTRTNSLIVISNTTLENIRYNENSSLTINHLVLRTKTAKLNVSTTGTFSNSTSYKYIAGKIQQDQIDYDGNIFNIELASDFSNSFSSGYFYIKPYITFGTNLLGAKNNKNYSAEGNYLDFNYQFVKFNLATNLCYFTSILNIKYCNNLNIQYSDMHLDSNDQIGVSVRGFNDTSYAGDTGFYTQNEISAPIPFFYNAFNGQIRNFISLQFYTAIDFGYANSKLAKPYGNKLDDGEFLSGLAWGIKNNAKWLTFKFEAALPLYHSRVNKNLSANEKAISKYEKKDINYSFDFTIKIW